MESNATGLKPMVPPASNQTRSDNTASAAETTALPREKVVAATDRAKGSGKPKASGEVAARATGQGQDQTPAQDDRQIEIDPETREVLFKITDADTGMVRWQVPAEALLNLRAYNTDTGVPTTRPESTDAQTDETGKTEEAGSRLTRDL